ncbi:MAG: TetR/AcrR family transcriptional regulator [Solirubrobacterales bacterium]
MSSSSPEDLRKWRLPRGRHGLPRELVTRSQRERLLAAVVRVTAAKGYEATTVADILEEAGVGRESFYELFDDKRDCMLAAHAILVENLEGKVRAAYAEPGPWVDRIRDALGAALDWFAADPAAARFTLVELAAVGPVSRARFQAAFGSFVELLDEGLDDGPGPELPRATTLAVSATLARVYEEVVLGRSADLPSLLPDLTYELLVPFLGEEAARTEQRRAAAG